MGKIFSLMTKPIREFNIESRAQAVISRDKPIAAPKHKADQMTYERLLKDHPEVMEESLRKNEELDKHLKTVFLTSHDPLLKEEAPISTNPDRPLPLDRTNAAQFEYGFYEPDRIPFGKTTLRKVLRFISEHHADTKVNKASKIAEEYLLPEKTVENILKYFKMYEIYIPTQRDTKAKFAGPLIPRTPRATKNQKLLGSYGKKKEDIFD